VPLTLPEFVERWKASTLSERSAAAQSHFIDLCEVLGQPHPAAADQTGESYIFEKHVSTNDDGKGYADVWSAVALVGNKRANTTTLRRHIDSFCATAKT
jgi:hypothetical protein